MAINLNSNTSYNLLHDSEGEPNKCVLFVKLTDSCLRAFEEYQTYKAGSKAKPKIRFDKSTGEINIPSKPGSASKHVWKKFNFASTTLHLGERQGCMECIHQPRKAKDEHLSSLGVPRCKLAVMASEDVYEMTRTKMAQADQERKEVRTKVIKINQVKSGKKRTITAPNSRLLTAVKKKVASNGTHANTQKVVNGTNGTSHPSKSIKQRIIQILALKPHKKLELLGRLDKDGAPSKARGALASVLNQVATFADNTYRLQTHLFRDLEIETWPYYTYEERERVKRNVSLSKRTDARHKDQQHQSSKSKPLETKTVKRPAPIEKSSNPPFVKKPRISPPLQDFRHSPSIFNDNSNRTVQKSTTQSNKFNHTNNNVITNNLQVEELPSKQEINNGSKGENSPPEKSESTSEMLSYLTTYVPISSYEQRCRYKQDFQSEYDLYRKLKDETDAVTRKFVELDRSWKRFKPDSKDAQKIQDEICRLYEQHQKDTEYQKRKQQYQQLQAKLSHIKRLVVDYDNAAVVKDGT